MYRGGVDEGVVGGTCARIGIRRSNHNIFARSSHVLEKTKSMWFEDSSQRGKHATPRPNDYFSQRFSFPNGSPNGSPHGSPEGLDPASTKSFYKMLDFEP